MYKTVDEHLLIELRCAFNMFDVNNDGTIEPEEFFNSVDFQWNLTSKDIKEMMNFMGAVSNGSDLTFPDFANLIVSKLRTPESEEELIEVFKIFDKKGIGKISKSEIKLVMNEIEEPITEEELIDLMKKFDADGDDMLNYEEFKNMMESK